MPDTVRVTWLVRDPAEVDDAEIVLDEDRRIAGLYGLADEPCSVVVDPNLRVLATVPIDDADRHAANLVEALTEARAAEPALNAIGAPALLVPRVFEPEFCRLLVSTYDTTGGTESGFVRDENGQTVAVIDYTHKRRQDVVINDPDLRKAMKQRIERRLVPEIKKAFQFDATRIERYLIARYDSTDGGHFRPHRDNTTKGTAHRKFAVTINLNTEFDGGDLRFPEFGTRTYRVPLGAAIVFSCSLLHEVIPVTAGRRYCTIPFLYDEAGEALRQRNLPAVNPGLTPENRQPRVDG